MYRIAAVDHSVAVRVRVPRIREQDQELDGISQVVAVYVRRTRVREHLQMRGRQRIPVVLEPPVHDLQEVGQAVAVRIANSKFDPLGVDELDAGGVVRAAFRWSAESWMTPLVSPGARVTPCNAGSTDRAGQPGRAAPVVPL